MRNEYEYETPFADIKISKEQNEQYDVEKTNQFSFEDFISPFQKTYESEGINHKISPYAEEYVSLLGELDDNEFHESLYELAYEMENSWQSKISDELAMGQQYKPFAIKQARIYYSPIMREVDNIFDKAEQHYSGNDLSDHSELEVDMFFETLELKNDSLTPIQEQFLGKLIKKVKSVVKKGVSIAKKGISVVGKFLPINIILNKLKALIKPLLEKVITSLITKLPRRLQPYAQSLAKKYLNLEQEDERYFEMNEYESLQLEFDNSIVQLFFTSDEHEADQQLMEYENSIENLERIEGYESNENPEQNLDFAKERFISELKNLKPDDDPTPVIERFLPVAIMALKPIIKMAISMVGRDKIINFMAGLLSSLVRKYVPEDVAKPLAASIIDLGMKAIGFEVYELNSTNVAYEAIANTIEETIAGMNEMESSQIENPEQLTLQLYESFEKAAAKNFPPSYIKPSLRPSRQRGMWINKPRKSPLKYYKKFSHIYEVNLDISTLSKIKTFRSVPILQFVKDKYGIEVTSSLKARVHLYELGSTGRLSSISHHENLPGLNPNVPRGFVQFGPLTQEASNLLLNEPNLGTNFDDRSLSSRYRVKPGQRFYYLEIDGARLRHPQTASKQINTSIPRPKQLESRSADVQAVLDFTKSEIKVNYYFSEEEAKSIVDKIAKNDVLGIGSAIKSSIHGLAKDILKDHISSKVKIIHEAMPEMYLESETDILDHFSLKSLGQKIGTGVINRLVEKLTELISSKAYNAIVVFMKARSKEFVDAQGLPEDGVTLTIKWKNISGMVTIKSIISAIKGNLTLPNLADLKLPDLTNPDLSIKGGKLFD